MTKKLYYEDAYIKEFSASVLSSEPTNDGFLTVLEETAFFPEEGGQSADTGYIGEATVVHVYEKDGIVYHLTDKQLKPGGVACRLDFEQRFDKMQQHTAEHILCGIIHSLYGYENVGFHLGDDVVTFDVDGVLSREELDRVEELANKAIFSNQRIECFFLSEGELSEYEYRAKLELTENVRLVKIGDVDVCACCAPHVLYTGEVGIVKILDFMKHRGGTRITMLAGKRALLDYRNKYENILKISAMLSIPQGQTADELARYIAETDALRSELKSVKLSAAERLADDYPDCDGNSFVFLEGFSMEEQRAFANAYKSRVGGYLVTVSGSEMDYKYIIMKKGVDLSAEIKEINKVLLGRGGGRGEMVSGSFLTTLDNIRKYFE